MRDELVAITSFGDALEAAAAMVELESAGIPALLKSTVRGGWAPNVRLMVAREDAMDAASCLGVLA